MIKMMRRKIGEWLLCRDAARRLEGLDDRLLADMGTRREDIDCFVQGCRSVRYEDPDAADWQFNIGRTSKRVPQAAGLLTSGL